MGVAGRKTRPSSDICLLNHMLSSQSYATPPWEEAANGQQIWALDRRCSISTALSHRHGMFLRRERGSDTPIQIQSSPPVCELWRPENKHALLLSSRSREEHSWLGEDREEQWVGAVFSFNTQLTGHRLTKRCKQRSTITVKQNLLTPRRTGYKKIWDPRTRLLLFHVEQKSLELSDLTQVQRIQSKKTQKKQ